MKLFYSPDYVGAAHSFDTTRKAGWIAESLADRPIGGVELLTPPSLTADDLARVHDADYIRAIRTGQSPHLAESQGFDWDPALWPMVLASNGGVLAAARSALGDGVAGSLSSGLHHAKRDRGEGFCTFNGLVIAAKALLHEGAVDSVLILDLDAHCGGGTAELIDDDPRIWHEDVSVSGYDHYSGHANSALWDVDRAEDYLKIVNESVAQADRRGPVDLCLYNAGMDPFQGCDVGGLDGVTAQVLAERERLVFDWCRERGCRWPSSWPAAMSEPTSARLRLSICTGSPSRRRRGECRGGRSVSVRSATLRTIAEALTYLEVSPAMAQGKLVYGVAGSDLVFLDAGLAEELANLRDGFGTWGQARIGLSASRWCGIVELLEGGELPVPGDDELFDLDYIPGYADGDWPEWPARLMLDWMPHEIIDAYGTREDSALNGEFVSIDPGREAEAVAALQKAGWEPAREEALVRRACGFTAE